MKKIGDILRTQRIEQGYSLEDIHRKTKLSMIHLKAIEDGNLEYFRHDLSYLKFFLQYYCQAVKLDYSIIQKEYEDTVEQYAETQALKKIQQKNESNKNIQLRVKTHQQNYTKPIHKEKFQFSRIEGNTWISIIIIIFVALMLIIGSILLIKGLTTPKSDPVPEKIEIPEKIDPEVKVNQETAPILPEKVLPKVELEAIYEDGRKVILVKNHNPKKPSTITITFNNDTWVSTYVNGELVADPASTVYLAQSTLTLPLTETTQNVLFGVGFIGNNVYKVDDLTVDLSDIVGEVNGYNLEFRIIGVEE